MFHWDNGLILTGCGLAIDSQRRRQAGFVSHAHADHMARHELALGTPATMALYQHRLGPRRVKEMPYGETIDWADLRLTTFPAGHCLGSAMLLVDDGHTTMLYTGDFKLGESATAERAELPEAETLILECTFGKPKYRMPPRDETIARLVELVGEALDRGARPIVEAYALGKAQEVTRILTDAGFFVLQDRATFQLSQIYESFDVDLGPHDLLTADDRADAVWVVPPRRWTPETERPEVRFAVTGWAIDESTKYRLKVDHALPLSDHADFDELFEAVRRVNPKRVYCTHGQEEFVHRLQENGWDAHPLGRSEQGRLF